MINGAEDSNASQPNTDEESEEVLDEATLAQVISTAKRPQFFIGRFLLRPVTVVLTLRSSVGSSSVRESNGLSGALSCENMVLTLKAMELRDVNGGYLDVFRAFRGYLLRELFKQMWDCGAVIT